jgi:molybdate transport system substrate-binding protein
MKKRWHGRISLVYVAAAVLTLPPASFAQVKVFVSGGFWAASEELLPEFEKNTGISVTKALGKAQGSGPDNIGDQLRRGVPADVVIMSKEALGELIAEGTIAAETEVDLAQIPLGVYVRAGAPKPDISTVDAFKKALLRASSITVPNSTIGSYLATKLFPQLGIPSEVAGKITNTGVVAVARGDAEIAIQPVSELLHVPGTDFVGTIPAEIQYVSVFSAAMVAGSKEPEASKRLIAFLASENAAKVIKKSGMEPSRSR